MYVMNVKLVDLPHSDLLNRDFYILLHIFALAKFDVMALKQLLFSVIVVEFEE